MAVGNKRRRKPHLPAPVQHAVGILVGDDRVREIRSDKRVERLKRHIGLYHAPALQFLKHAAPAGLFIGALIVGSPQAAKQLFAGKAGFKDPHKRSGQRAPGFVSVVERVVEVKCDCINSFHVNIFSF